MTAPPDDPGPDPVDEHGPVEVVTGPPEVPERSSARWIALSLILAALAGVALLIVYAAGGQVQIEGALLAILLGGIGFAFIFWGKYLFRPEIVTEGRGSHASEPSAVAAAEDTLERSTEEIGRRKFLIRLMVGAFGALGLAAIFPFRSLGPDPGDSLFNTPWRRGSRVVDADGNPVKAVTLEVNGVISVFPAGHIDADDAQAIIIRVDEDLLDLPDGREGWAPLGNVCYSKLCTHAGCPVGLFLAQYHELQCPCHYSAFDVLNGAQPVFGPATTPLPQLPLYIDDEGYFRAGGEFSATVGPGFWNKNKGPSPNAPTSGGTPGVSPS